MSDGDTGNTDERGDTSSDRVVTTVVSTADERAVSVKSALENAPEPMDVTTTAERRLHDRIADDRVDCVVCPGQFVDARLAVLEELADSAPSVPIVCWGVPDRTSLETALDTGITDYVRTPRTDDQYRLAARRVHAYGVQHRPDRESSAPTSRNHELERSLDLLEKTEELADAGGWEVDLESGTVRWTDGTRRLIGVDERHEPTQENALDFYHPDDRPRLESAIETAITTGTQFELQSRLVTADGDTRYVRVRGDPHREDGRTTRVRGSIWDVTERERQQRAARTSTAKLQALSEAFPDVALVHDEDGRYLEIYAGDSSESLLVDDPDDLVGEQIEDVLPPEQATRVRDTIDRTLETGELQTIEYQLEVRAGVRWFEGRVAPLEDRLDGKRAVVFVVRDVTEHKAITTELRKRESHLTQAQSMADLGSWQYDFRTDELEWSDEVYRLFGTTRAEMPTVTIERFYDIVHPEDEPFVRHQWERALEGAPYEFEHRIVVDGETRWVRENAEFTFDDGEAVSATGVVQDITAQKRYERRLEAQNQQLDVLNRIIRHDLRNQLNVIDGYASVLEDRLGVDEPLATEIRSVAEELLGMGEEIRTVNRLLTDDDRHTATVSTIAERAITSVREEYSGFECQHSIEDELWVRGTDVLEIALRHLVENAIEHNDAARPRLEIAASKGPSSDVVAIRIADNGPGIPDSEHELLTGDRERSQLEHSSGLGLWIVNWIVSSVGGTLAFENAESRGTIVTIRLPSADGPEPDDERRRDERLRPRE